MAGIACRIHALVRTQRQNTRSTAGFTMVELLAAIAILAILGTLVASAMATGSRVMVTTTTASNASVLEQSIDTALTDVLRFASVHANEGYGEQFDGPTFDSDSTTDAAGAPVRGGYIGVEDGHIVLVTSAGSVSVPKSAGIYTDFTVREDDFTLQYNTASNLFTGSYTLVGSGGQYERTCTFACRTLVEETAV